MRSSIPATILMLVACILFVLVTCSTPVIKSLSFLEATIGGSGSESGQKATLGCLGYCIGDTCQGPTVGYSFNPNQLLGIASSVEGYQVNSSKYSTALIKGLTYCLILNPIALATCVICFITGVLGHCGGFGLVCLNGVFSSIASTVSLVAVALNFVLFVLAKKRIDDISGASAQYGIALWLALAGWIVVILSSCAFCCACGGRGDSGGKSKRNKMQDEDAWNPPLTGTRNNGNSYADQMRMDALQAESDRKRRNQNLPKFATYETEHVEELPLKQDYEDSFAHHTNGPYTGGSSAAHNGYGGGYQPNYGYAYGDESSYSMHHLGANADPTYIAGVGTGAPRNAGPQPQPAAGRYYDASIPPVESHDNLAGYGAHDLTSPATTVPPHIGHGQYGSAMGTPVHPMPEPMSHNASNGEMDYFYNTNPATGGATGMAEDEGIQSHDAYGGYVADQRSQNTHQQYDQYDQYASAARGGKESMHDYQQPQSPPIHQSQQGHAFEYSGATFGGGGAGKADPYDAVQQATVAGRSSRRLPSVPGTTRGGADELVFSPPSTTNHHEGFGVNSVPSPRQATGDDGFGLAVLQAGAAAAGGSSTNGGHPQYHDSDQPPPMYSEPVHPSQQQYQGHYSSSEKF